MRSEGSIEGALHARVQLNQGGKGKKNKKNNFDSSGTSGGTKFDFPPCKHYRRKGHPPLKCWRRPD